MRHCYVFIGVAAMLAGCGGSSENAAANEAAANAAKAKKKIAYCFFKDSETKDWAASRDKDGNVLVKGKAYRQDSRYKAVLGPPAVTGASADIAPSITANDTGFGAPENWWEVSAVIPNSAAVDTVTVRCGAKSLAELKIPPRS